MSINTASHTSDVKSRNTKKRKRNDKSDIHGKSHSKAHKSRKGTSTHESEEINSDVTASQPNPSDLAKHDSTPPPLHANLEKPSRFIVFVGNLPYNCSTSAVEKHFTKVKPAKVRHITDKDNGTSKGYAFLEFEGYDRMKTCLNTYHGTKVKGRKIRVELTAGGGGAKSQIRRDRIAAKNLRLNGQRFRREQEELGERSKAGDERANDEKVEPKAEKIRSKARHEKKAVKRVSEKSNGMTTLSDREQTSDGNADVHPSRRKLLNR